jgi:hypothetical protein
MGVKGLASPHLLIHRHDQKTGFWSRQDMGLAKTLGKLSENKLVFALGLKRCDQGSGFCPQCPFAQSLSRRFSPAFPIRRLVRHSSLSDGGSLR